MSRYNKKISLLLFGQDNNVHRAMKNMMDKNRNRSMEEPKNKGIKSAYQDYLNCQTKTTFGVIEERFDWQNNDKHRVHNVSLEGGLSKRVKVKDCILSFENYFPSSPDKQIPKGRTRSQKYLNDHENSMRMIMTTLDVSCYFNF
jgi:hypothetical protein